MVSFYFCVYEMYPSVASRSLINKAVQYSICAMIYTLP